MFYYLYRSTKKTSACGTPPSSSLENVCKKIAKKLNLNSTQPKFSATPIDTWTFMGSPAPLVLTFVFYLFFVLSVGPRFMQDRKAYKLSGFIRSYNVFQVIACMFFVEWSVNRGTTYKSTWRCTENQIDPRLVMELCEHTWYFMILRMIELVETVIFVLRKKQNQVSALHIYHHMSTIVLLWIFLKYSPSKWNHSSVVSRKYCQSISKMLRHICHT